ncbi:MAG TPA: hypothetical protein VGR85_02105 [Candidatus Limnocylindria bacterium]|jgi:hypothetical protein|nr:hypothetical protein [Candidatus Limnocylindria bacterium]
MSALISDTREQIARSERLRVTALACFSGVLGVVFIALLVADEVHAAGL